MKARLFFVLTLVAVFSITALAGGGTGKTKAKNDSKSCCMEKASATKVSNEQCNDTKTASASQCSDKKVASAKMDCCAKDAKGAKASNSTKTSNSNSTVKLAKDTK